MSRLARPAPSAPRASRTPWRARALALIALVAACHSIEAPPAPRSPPARSPTPGASAAASAAPASSASAAPAPTVVEGPPRYAAPLVEALRAAATAPRAPAPRPPPSVRTYEVHASSMSCQSGPQGMRCAPASHTAHVDWAPAVLALGATPAEEVGDPQPTLSVESVPEFVSAAALALKAKAFDDGLVAAIDAATVRGAGTLGSRLELLAGLARALGAAPEPGAAPAQARVAAASALGGRPLAVPPPVAGMAEQLTAEFLADPGRSKPIAFYTWDAELRGVFLRDRLLQAALPTAEAGAFTAALAADAALLGAYEAALTLAEGLTNPFVQPDLRAAARTRRRAPGSAPPERAALFPASRSHEVDLLARLFGGRPIPPDFDLVAELTRQVRSGELALKPTARSGWYDWVTWALEPLAAPERTPEARRLVFEPSYRDQLARLFRGLMALSRETQAKALSGYGLGAAPPGNVLQLAPTLTVEPLPTHYLRRAQGYQFVRGVLVRALGAEALGQLARRSEFGPSSLTLADELDLMEALYLGAYLVSSEELRLPAAPPHGSRWEGRAAAVRALFAAWRASADADPDLTRDVRVMVPLAYDAARGQYKVWVVRGVALTSLDVAFSKPPVVRRVTTDAGDPAALDAITLELESTSYETAEVVAHELYTPRLLDRTEWRRLCDEHTTLEAVQQALQ